jgi:hypothetical protein
MSDDWASRERERILPEVERSQAELREAIEELQTVVQRRFDLAHRIAERPVPWLIGGFLFGVWMSRKLAH